MPKFIVLNNDEVECLYRLHGDLKQVARLVGVSRLTLMKYMDKHGIERKKNGEFFIDKDELLSGYAKYKSTRVLARKYGVCRSVIKRLCKLHEIVLEPRLPSIRLVPIITSLIDKGASSKDIADELDLTIGYVNELAKKYQLPLIKSYHKGYIITWNGYKKLYAPNDVDADSKGYVHEHRRVMADSLGIESIPKNMVVHHINENKRDNRPENLAMMTLEAHSKHHRDIKI